MQISVVFPHQLFAKHPALHLDRQIWLIEDPLFFGDWQYPISFHKQKLILHRASMKTWAAERSAEGYQIRYIEYADVTSKATWEKLWQSVSKTTVCDPEDDVLMRRLKHVADIHSFELEVLDSPSFLTSSSELEQYHAEHHSWRMAEFYPWQRKRLGILVTGSGKPVGGKWSFDTENRRRLPEEMTPPSLPKFREQDVVREAKRYILEHFPDNYGSCDTFEYPISHRQAVTWLEDFLKKRLIEFGPYEDAISRTHRTLFHSVLSSSLNAGLLTPAEVIKQTITFAAKHSVPPNSLEGFIRQVIGWREFVRAVYRFEGVRQRKSNFFASKRKLPNSFWTGKTGIEPFDQAVQQVLATGYAHHIERLMIFGNLMLLCDIDPDEVYRWFMSLFIDAYDWVMVPNIYGMSQFSDGGLMVTKPYFSGSNYLRKMSDYPSGAWCNVWDGLYWRFVQKHRHYLASQPRLGMMVRLFDSFASEKQETLLQSAETFLRTLR